MGLSNDLLSQFAKLTNNKPKKSTETTVYGTVKAHGDGLYIQLDGSELLTPVATTASYKVGERVAVQIKNHTATVTGNLTSPSARNADVVEVKDTVFGKATIQDLNAINAYIDNLKAITANIEGLEAVNAEIENLRAEYAKLDHISAEVIEALNIKAETIRAKVGEFTNISTSDLEAINANISNLIAYNATFTYVSADILNAVKAEIKELDADKLSVKDANLTYANIDFSNIKMAAVEELFTKSGIIKDLVVGEQKITGELVGVTIKGDLIEANTLKADRLLIQGEDGLYYKLNVDSLGETTASSDPKYQTGLDGSVIIAKSIAATKIAVTDLVAFGATIGGFKINDDSIHSAAKSSVNNTTRGIYYDNDGQMAFGDSNNFVKFYKDSDNKYRLDVSAESFAFGDTNYLMRVETNKGLIIGNLVGNAYGKNVLLDSDSVDIRNGDTVLASFGDKNILLGKNSPDAKINLCDGYAQMSVVQHPDASIEWPRFNITSTNNLELIAGGMFIAGTSYNHSVNKGWSANVATSERIISGYLTMNSASEVSVANPNNFTPTIELTLNDWFDNGADQSNSTLQMQSNKILLGIDYWAMDYMDGAGLELIGKTSENKSQATLTASKIALQGEVTFPVGVAKTRANLGVWMYDLTTNTSYPGLARPDGTTTGYVRTPQTGIIPYQTGGHGTVGTATWPFNNGYFKNIDVSGVRINSSSNLVLPNGKAVYGTQTDGSTTRSMLYMNNNNDCIIGYGGYSNNDGETSIYGTDVFIFSKTADAYYKPYYTKGDSVTINWNGAGFISNSSKSIYFVIPLAKPVVGATTVSIANTGTVSIRQHYLNSEGKLGGHYIYGTTSSGDTKASTYVGEITSDGNQVKVTLTMSNTTNAVNNSPCGIYASLRFTFS